MKFDTLHLWHLADPSSPALVGTLRLVSNGLGVSLEYAPSWRTNGFPLSEDLPLIDIEHLPFDRELAAGAVDDARPDRWGERVIQVLERPSRLSIMEFLYFAGADRFGALGVSASSTEYKPHSHGPLPKISEAKSVREAIRKIQEKQPIAEIEKRMIASGGSFSGRKPKALIDIDGVQYIAKFFAGEHIDLQLVEHASMTLAKTASIDAAETRILPLQTENVLLLKRFDRQAERRIHVLSAAVAIRSVTMRGSRPDFGYPALAQILRRSGSAKDGVNRLDMAQLFRRMIFNILIDNTDDHEKNHALLSIEPQRPGMLRLAPAYDVLPTASGQGRHEFRIGRMGHEGTLENAISECEMFGLAETEARSETAFVAEVVEGWKTHFKSAGVSDADIDTIAQTIDADDLKRQREEFARFSKVSSSSLRP